MEEVAAVKRATSRATADVVPEPLRETIDEYVADGSVVPGVLTLLSARTVTGTDPEGLAEQAAGVQLIYDGLRLTRDLAQKNPWGADADTPRNDAASTDPATDYPGDHTEADLAVLAADVLVARGFYLLARTAAATDAVGVVRAFGRDQTNRETAGDRAADLDCNLEADILELAVTAGVAAACGRTDDAAGLAAALAPERPQFAPAETFFDEGRRDHLAGLSVDGRRPLNRND